MPTKAAAIPVSATGADIASRRILRLALGTALSLCFSQIVAWPVSFIAPVFTMFILALPLPAPTLRGGVKFVAALLLPLMAGTALLPFLHDARWVGIGLVAIALFYSFYFTARGGSAVLGTFITVGLTMVVTVGSVDVDAIFGIALGVALGAIVGIAFVWIAHAFLPEPPVVDPEAAPKRAPLAAKPSASEARRNAVRAMVVTFPMALVFLFMSASTSYTVVMIKVASMGQQATTEHSRQMGRSLLASTLWGGLGALLAWKIMQIWPSLILYTLLIGLAGLLYGTRIFRGAGMHPKFSMWAYAFLTMIVILAPAVLDGQGSSGAGAAFWSRLVLFVLIAVYGTLAVAVFDAFWPEKEQDEESQ